MKMTMINVINDNVGYQRHKIFSVNGGEEMSAWRRQRR